jgi:hypothetical protein
MRDQGHSAVKRLALVGAMAAAAAIGGFTTAAVFASIPDSNGVISACYPKSGTLRVIDSPSEGCKKNETAINWSTQGGGELPAYGHIAGTYDESETWTYQVDNGRLSGVTSVELQPSSENSAETVACITAEFEPRNIGLTGGNSFPPDVAIRDSAVSTDGGWSSPEANAECGTEGANAYIGSVGPDTWFVLYP